MSKLDTKLLDFLQKKNNESNYTGSCIFRMSSTGRGWRLHETSKVGGNSSVRKAILIAMEKEEKNGK